jgi:uncharacterized protein (TIGR02599 family)
MVVLSLVLVVLASLTEQTRKVWKQTSQRIDAFGAARAAFESLTRNLSQATLNTYWDYDSITAPQHYVRRSELRFASGPLALPTSGANAGHSVFFQAPLGYSESGSYRGYENLLNTCGYYLELKDDGSFRPSFLDQLPSPEKRKRFRLMELREPSERLTIYAKSSGNPGYKAADWYTAPLAAGNVSHVLAENVIALILLPKDPPSQTVSGTPLSASYSYATAPASWPPSYPQAKTENQLPPLIQVTMVAIDEASAQRLARMGGDPVAILGLNNLFVSPGNLADPSSAGFARDLKTLEDTLQSLHLSYRVFTSVVSIRGSKWSKEQ